MVRKCRQRKLINPYQWFRIKGLEKKLENMKFSVLILFQAMMTKIRQNIKREIKCYINWIKNPTVPTVIAINLQSKITITSNLNRILSIISKIMNLILRDGLSFKMRILNINCLFLQILKEWIIMYYNFNIMSMDKSQLSLKNLLLIGLNLYLF